MISESMWITFAGFAIFVASVSTFVGADHPNCTPSQPMGDCCYVNEGTLMCQQKCPSGYYNVSLGDAFGIHDGTSIFKKGAEWLAKMNTKLYLWSQRVANPSEYFMCKQCDVACANCSGQGDTKCLSCAEQYERKPGNSDRCTEVKLTGTGHRHEKGLSTALSIWVVALVIVVSILLCFSLFMYKSGRIHRCISRLKPKQATYITDHLEETDISHIICPDEEPIFCRHWQFWEDFDWSGGRLQGEQSDVVLALPVDAVKGTQSLRGAIYTDFDQAHRILSLRHDEHIVTPIAEYHTKSRVRFHKPVEVILPHFLPPSWTEEAVTIYQIQRNENGDVTKTKLEVGHKDCERHSGTCYIDNDRVHIFTDHFTAFCGICNVEYMPQQLVLDVWAKHLEVGQGRRLVEVRLYVWIGAKFQTKDCRAKYLAVDELANFKGMKCIDIKPMLAHGTDDLSVLLRAELKISDQMQEVWRHCHLDGEIKHRPPTVYLPRGELQTCSCEKAVHQLVEWQLNNKDGTAPSDVMDCCVIVSYVTKDKEPIDKTQRVITDVKIKKIFGPQGVVDTTSFASLDSANGSMEQDFASISTLSEEYKDSIPLIQNPRPSQQPKRAFRSSSSSSTSGDNPSPVSSRTSDVCQVQVGTVKNMVIMGSSSPSSAVGAPQTAERQTSTAASDQYLLNVGVQDSRDRDQ